jgi:hypothetical protein
MNTQEHNYKQKLFSEILKGIPKNLRKDYVPKPVDLPNYVEFQGVKIPKITTHLCDCCNQVLPRGSEMRHYTSKKHKKRLAEWEQEIINAHNEE